MTCKYLLIFLNSTPEFCDLKKQWVNKFIPQNFTIRPMIQTNILHKSKTIYLRPVMFSIYKLSHLFLLS